MFKHALEKCEEAECDAQRAREELNEDIRSLEDALYEVRDFLDMGLIQKAKDGIDKIIKSWQPERPR
jgi:hypothetical protein